MSTLAGPTLPPTPVDLTPEEIEHTLGDLWREIEGVESGITQVRMLNLLVYLPRRPDVEVSTAISSVAIQHPGRTITLIFDDGPPRAEATIACRVGDGTRHACGEQITLRGSVAGRPLHSLAVSLLPGGLPVTIWWHGPADFDGHLFGELANVADQIIVDSRTWPEPLPAFTALIEAVRRYSLLRFSDLQWAALTPWRRLIAHAFDLPAACRTLPDMYELEIDYGGAAPVSAGALLLAGWLMSRLGWEVAGATARDVTGYVLPLRRTGVPDRDPLMLALRRRGAEEGIRAVQMRAAGEQPGHLAFDVTPDELHIRTSIRLHDVHPLLQTVRLRRREPAELLSEELALTTGDPVYEAALVAAASLAEALAPMLARR